MSQSQDKPSTTAVATTKKNTSKTLTDALNRLRRGDRYGDVNKKQSITENDLNTLEGTVERNKFKYLNMVKSGFVERIYCKNYSRTNAHVSLASAINLPGYFTNVADTNNLKLTIISSLLDAFSYNTEKKEYDVKITKHLTTYAGILATGQLPDIEFIASSETKTESIMDANTTPLDLLKKRFPGINTLEEGIIHLKLASMYFLVYMIFFMLRKSGTYKIATKPNEVLKAEEFSSRVKNIVSKTNNRKFALVNIVSVEQSDLVEQYSKEFVVVDCALLYVISRRLYGQSMEAVQGGYVTELNTILPTGIAINADNGSFEYAYAVALAFLDTMDKVLPDFSFTKELGYPDGLNQYDQVRDAASDLINYYRTANGVSAYLEKVVKNIDSLFADTGKILELYHPGHYAFKEMGRTATETMKDTISWISTLGAVLKGIRERDSTSTVNTSALSWLAIPMFKNAQLKAYEYRLLSQGLISLATKSNENLLNTVKQSMAITSGLNNLTYTNIELKDLRPGTISDADRQLVVPNSIIVSDTKEDVTSESESSMEEAERLKELANENF